MALFGTKIFLNLGNEKKKHSKTSRGEEAEIGETFVKQSLEEKGRLKSFNQG